MNQILETERLIVREIVENDDAFILDLLNQPSFIKYIGDRNVRTIDESREFIVSRYRKSYDDHGYGLYAVVLKETGEVVGINGFVRRDTLPDSDIGFAFLPHFEKKGYAFESAVALMKFGRERLGLKRLLAITTPDNESSGRLLFKLGFKYDGLEILPGDTKPVKMFSSDDR